MLQQLDRRLGCLGEQVPGGGVGKRHLGQERDREREDGGVAVVLFAPPPLGLSSEVTGVGVDAGAEACRRSACLLNTNPTRQGAGVHAREQPEPRRVKGHGGGREHQLRGAIPGF